MQWRCVLIFVFCKSSSTEAIILDAYSYEKEKASEDKTLLQQTSEVWRRRSQHRRGERVNLSQVYDAFKKEFKHDVSHG